MIIHSFHQSLVFACGVRKVWSKKLKDIEPISKQITHVRGILSDLGMKGRLSLEQARTIKERREFQQELGIVFLYLTRHDYYISPIVDEVREFAAKHAGEGRPKRSTATTSKPAVSSDSESEESEEEVVGPRRAKVIFPLFPFPWNRHQRFCTSRMRDRVLWHFCKIRATQNDRGHSDVCM